MSTDQWNYKSRFIGVDGRVELTVVPYGCTSPLATPVTTPPLLDDSNTYHRPHDYGEVQTPPLGPKSRTKKLNASTPPMNSRNYCMTRKSILDASSRPGPTLLVLSNTPHGAGIIRKVKRDDMRNVLPC